MTPVSRETPPARERARRAFPDGRWPLAERYADALATVGVERGLIGPREVPRLWERHLLNCVVLAPLLPHAARVCDLGSGAGLPGLVLAIARPDLEVTLVDPLLRRTDFLEEVVDQLGLDSVRVVRGRAESLHDGTRFDVVTARALAPLERLLVWAMPLVASRGELIAMKGSSVAEEIESSAATLAALHCSAPEVVELRDRDGLPTATVVRVAHADPTRVS